MRTGAQTLAGQQLAQGRGHAGRGSGVAGVAGKRLIQFRFPAVKAGDVVADLAQKGSQSCGAADGGQQQIGGAVIAHGNGGGAEFADRHAVGKMFFADRRVVHQILLAIVDLSLQLFVTGIHPRQHCAAEHYFKGAHHGKAFIGAPGGQRAAAGQIHFYHAYAARQLAFALFNLLKRLRAGVYRQRQGG